MLLFRVPLETLVDFEQMKLFIKPIPKLRNSLISGGDMHPVQMLHWRMLERSTGVSKLSGSKGTFPGSVVTPSFLC